jgi:CRISPR system Cascade subunit CasE
MNQLYMLELKFDVASLYRFLHTQGLPDGEDDAALSYGIHAWLSTAFGELAPVPWRLLMDKHRPPRILGYTHHAADSFQQRLTDFAEPGVFQVCPEPQVMIASRVMPTWQVKRKIGFQTLVCPIGRKSRSGVEKDLFLIHADAQDSNTQLDREKIYCEWVKQKFNDFSVTVDKIRLSGFRLVKQKRKTQATTKNRAFHRIIRPSALLEGVITIKDPAKFNLFLKRGIGRHRSFGFGMILLRPPS